MHRPRFAIIGNTSRLRRSQSRRVREQQFILRIGHWETRRGLTDRVGYTPPALTCQS